MADEPTSVKVPEAVALLIAELIPVVKAMPSEAEIAIRDHAANVTLATLRRHAITATKQHRVSITVYRRPEHEEG